MAVFVGIDPGASGAIAFYDPDRQILDVHDMPAFEVAVAGKSKKRVDPYGLAILFRGRQDVTAALIEDVNAMPKQGIASAFAFGRSLGNVESVVAANQIPIRWVRPTEWKGLLRLRAAKDEARALATRKFPRYAELWQAKTNADRAEAALLAHLCAEGVGR